MLLDKIFFAEAEEAPAAELIETAETTWHTVFSSKLFYVFLLLLILFASFKIIDIFLKVYAKRGKKNPFIGFLAGALKALFFIVILFRILSLYGLMDGLASQVLMSSSLLVAVLGFIFQEGLSNIVHGLILSIFNPFKIGDRVVVTVDGESITGYVKYMTLRGTVITNVMDSSEVIVPNSKMDTCTIKNSYLDESNTSTSFLDMMITYESDLHLAIDIIREEIAKHPVVAKERELLATTDPVPLFIRDLADSGVAIRAIVQTRTIEENFQACSDLRLAIWERFREVETIQFAYPHIEILAKELILQKNLDKT